MVTLNELGRGQEFYFENDRSQLFVILGFIYRKDGTIKTARCCKPGKLYPVYINATRQVIVLQTPVINLLQTQEL